MRFTGPIQPSFYLSFDDGITASAAGAGGRLRVIGSNGYPHDIKVTAGQPASMRPKRIFAPVVEAGGTLELQVSPEAHLNFKVLCANCFAEMYSRPIDVTKEAIAGAEATFWETDAIRDKGCPRCFAAAAKPH